jgi:hypothetical protein
MPPSALECAPFDNDSQAHQKSFTMKQTLGHWTPAAFCAFISLTALFASSGPDAEWWRPAFFAFLPMCFFFVGAATSQMQREIRELRKQIVGLQEKRVG